MKSQEIKKYLVTKLNCKPSDLSIRKDNCMYSEAFRIYIKQAHININEVEKLARQRFESVDRDEVTGEILSGGNTYIFVEYDTQAFEQVGGQFNKNLEYALIKKWNEKAGGDCVPFADGVFYSIKRDEFHQENYIEVNASYPKYSIRRVDAGSTAYTFLRYGYFREMCEFMQNN